MSKTGVSGSHYGNTEAQPIDLLTTEEKRAFYKGNIIKYVARYRYKNGIDDLNKAKQYLDWLIDLEIKAFDYGEETKGENKD